MNVITPLPHPVLWEWGCNAIFGQPRSKTSSSSVLPRKQPRSQRGSLQILARLQKVSEGDMPSPRAFVRAVVELEDCLRPSTSRNHQWQVLQGNLFMRYVGTHFLDPSARGLEGWVSGRRWSRIVPWQQKIMVGLLWRWTRNIQNLMMLLGHFPIWRAMRKVMRPLCSQSSQNAMRALQILER